MLVAGVSVNADTTCATVTCACAVRKVPDVVDAVMVDVPLPTLVTRPVDDTVATLVAEEVKLNVVPLTVPPTEFRAVAVSCCVAPIALMLIVV